MALSSGDRGRATATTLVPQRQHNATRRRHELPSQILDIKLFVRRLCGARRLLLGVSSPKAGVDHWHRTAVLGQNAISRDTAFRHPLLRYFETSHNGKPSWTRSRCGWTTCGAPCRPRASPLEGIAKFPGRSLCEDASYVERALRCTNEAFTSFVNEPQERARPACAWPEECSATP
ncbi:hypothetical protein BGW80DRAFT_599075 [Lactifluus volemus]|nr:hypothetical protein BGW80DRAFT_599075 [Lactifluus volemus]